MNLSEIAQNIERFNLLSEAAALNERLNLGGAGLPHEPKFGPLSVADNIPRGII